MTETDIQRLLYWQHLIHRSRDVGMPNVFVYGGNESDYLTITKAGFVDEYEIKISRADFLADKRKDRHERYQVITPWRWDSGSVHEYVGGERMRWPYTYLRQSTLADQYPNRFWYVVPDGLVGPDDLPSYAGLTYVKDDNRCTDIVKAPQLHKEKAPNRVRAKVMAAAYHRFNNFWIYEKSK